MVNVDKVNTVPRKDLPDHTEQWVKRIIVGDPGILGLGDVVVLDSERFPPGNGSLDLLLCDPAANRRYEVEIRLGASGVDLLIDAIAYWREERNRHPQYDHRAVLIAEEVTGLVRGAVETFQGVIPITAIEMKFGKASDGERLAFSTVAVSGPCLPEEEDAADRKYWESRTSEAAGRILGKLTEWIKEFAPACSLRNKKYFYEVVNQGVPQDFVSFLPFQDEVLLHAKHEQDEAIRTRLEESDLFVFPYEREPGQYVLGLNEADLVQGAEAVKWLMKKAYGAWMK